MEVQSKTANYTPKIFELSSFDQFHHVDIEVISTEEPTPPKLVYKLADVKPSYRKV